MAGPWEVEQKFIVSDAAQLLERLVQFAATEMPTELHVDTYLAHPCRDFRATDEAFRVRQFNSEACITYKGKRLPGNVKTRPEIELSIRHAEIPQWLEIMQHLGFQPKPQVLKTRRIFSVADDQNSPSCKPFTVAIDEVDQLGTFAEIELLVDDAELLEEARNRIEQLALSLGLSQVQPRSYLGLLLAKLGVD
jgi:adenylate cyclase class 2